MGQRKLSQEKLQEIRDLAASWGKVVASQVLENKEEKTVFDFQDLEQIVQEATAGLAQGAFDALLDAQTQSLGAEQPCLDCGRLCRVGCQERPLFIKGGKINFREPICHCLTCRRDFFPPEDPSASG